MKDLPDICLEIENNLPLWVGGDLEPEAQRAVEEHLSRCGPCADKGAKARRARTALRRGLSLQVEGVGTGFDPWLRIRSQLQAEGVLPGEPGARPHSEIRLPGPRISAMSRSRQPWFVLSGSLAAAALLAFLFTWNRIPAGDAATGPPPSVATSPDTGPRTVPSTMVVKPARLRRLAPDERRLRDSAQVFGPPDEWMGSQASFERPPSFDRPGDPPPR